MLRTRSALACLAALGTLTIGTVAAVNGRPKPQEYPQPTAEHAMLLKAVGNWEGSLTMAIPGMEAAPIPGVEVIEAVEPFWVQTRFECDFMGMAFEGRGCTGYDSTKKKFVGTWIDNMSSDMKVMEGDYDAASRKLTMNFKAPDMMGAIVPQRIETVYTDDSYTSSFFVGEGAAAMKTMVIEMKRKSDKPVEAGAGR